MTVTSEWAYPVGVGYPQAAERVERHLRAMQRRYRARDQKWDEVRAIRRGEWEYFPEMITDAFPKPIVQNFIDTTARDLAEMLAPLPSFNCSSASMRSDQDRRTADMRTKIANNYVTNSRLGVQLLSGADHYWTYGLTAFYMEPDHREKMPRIVVEDPYGTYPEFDRWDRLLSWTKRIWADAHVLADLYPEYADLILKQARESVGSESEWRIEMILYRDRHGETLVLGGKHPLVIDFRPYALGRIPMVVAKRPNFEPMEIKGQFDDVTWIQVARNMMAVLQFEAVEKAVQAPLAVGNDVVDLAIGPDAIIRTDNPQGIRRVGLEMTNMSFLESNTLLQDLQAGSRYPAVRSGEIDASVVTGRGAMALQSGLDQQLKSAQQVMKNALMDVMSVCFEMDVKLWPEAQKTIEGVEDGTPYEVRYTPRIHIGKDRSCSVEYGIASGLDVNRAVVLLLQLRAERVFSRDYLARQIPFDIDVTTEATKVAVEDSRDALMQGFFAMLQSIPAMIQSGVDPTEVIRKGSDAIRRLQKGEPVEEVFGDVFAPEEPAPEEMAGLAGGPGGVGGPGGGELGGGLNPSGLMAGVAPGQAGMAPGGRPDLNTFLSGITSGGKPVMSAITARKRRV